MINNLVPNLLRCSMRDWRKPSPGACFYASVCRLLDSYVISTIVIKGGQLLFSRDSFRTLENDYSISQILDADAFAT